MRRRNDRSLDAVRAADVRVAYVHIRAGDPKTARPATEHGVYREITTGFKAGSKVIVCITTGETGLSGSLLQQSG